MGLNDRHFTSPDPYPGQSMEHYRNDVAFRQQLASAFRVIGPHNVQMETGHVLLPATGHNGGDGPNVVVHHPHDEFDRSIYLPLGHDPRNWMSDLSRHLNSRDVMQQMHDQMTSSY